MTKIALITDIHFGIRNDSEYFLQTLETFLKEIFFPIIDKENIKVIINLGDTFDRRKYINYRTLQKAKEIFFDQIIKREIWCLTLIGNHDTFYKNTNETNAIDLVLKEYHDFETGIEPIINPQNRIVDGYDICFIPWICQNNQEDALELIKKTNAKICMGHLAINGFFMDKNSKEEENGLSRELFEKFNIVFSGHFHHRSNNGKIFYLGNPYESTWSDFDDCKGFHIYNLKTGTLEFIHNTYKVYYKFDYDDLNNDYKKLTKSHFSTMNNSFIKVNIKNKTKPDILEHVLKLIYENNPFSVDVISNFSNNLCKNEDEEMLDQTDDVVTIITKYVEKLHKKNPEFDLKHVNKILIDAYNMAIADEFLI